MPNGAAAPRVPAKVSTERREMAPGPAPGDEHLAGVLRIAFGTFTRGLHHLRHYTDRCGGGGSIHSRWPQQPPAGDSRHRILMRSRNPTLRSPRRGARWPLIASDAVKP